MDPRAAFYAGFTHDELVQTAITLEDALAKARDRMAELDNENLRLREQAGDTAEGITRAAGDLQPVVALIASGGVLGVTAETLIRRAFDTLAEGEHCMGTAGNAAGSAPEMCALPFNHEGRCCP